MIILFRKISSYEVHNLRFVKCIVTIIIGQPVIIAKGCAVVSLSKMFWDSDVTKFQSLDLDYAVIIIIISP